MDIENVTLQIEKLNISNNDNMCISNEIHIENEIISKFNSLNISNKYNIKLSNMFYSKDEIEISFITKLLTYEELENTDLENEIHMKEILFWINEYFKSDFSLEFNSASEYLLTDSLTVLYL